MPLQTYYVMLLPDNTILVKTEYDRRNHNERFARECWQVYANTKEEAIGKVLGFLYTQVVQLSAKLADEQGKAPTLTPKLEYVDPNANAFKDAIDSAVALDRDFQELKREVEALKQRIGTRQKVTNPAHDYSHSVDTCKACQERSLGL